MKVPELLEGVCDLDRSSSVPLSQQIYRALREAVGQGRLKAGMRLPSSRSFAQQQGISRNTVNTAYELLKAEGIVEVSAGVAPVIVGGTAPEGAKIQSGNTVSPRGLSKRGNQLAKNLRGDSWGQRHEALQPGAPALDIFPYENWARCLRRAVTNGSVARSALSASIGLSGVESDPCGLSRK
jgi:GntR family transcriptional regulator/MocR family aminotransferase